MPQIVQTHINALYADLATAKQEAAVAQGRVELLEDQIRGRDGVVPGEEVKAPETSKEDTADSSDISAAETKPTKKATKK